jgi:hypothetical protein
VAFTVKRLRHKSQLLFRHAPFDFEFIMALRSNIMSL